MSSSPPPSRLWQLFDTLLLPNPRPMLLLALLFIIVIGYGAKDFRLDASAETLILENDEDLKYARLIAARYGTRDYLVLTYTPHGDLLGPESLAHLHQLRREIMAVPRVSSVQTLLNVPLVESPPVSLKALATDIQTLESPGVDVNLARIELQNSPLYRNLLISPDFKTTAILIVFKENQAYRDKLRLRTILRELKRAGVLSADEQRELNETAKVIQAQRDRFRVERHADIKAIRDLMVPYRQDADLFLGGVSMIADDMITFVRRDIRTFGIGVVCLLIGALCLIFRSTRWVLLPLCCCLVSALCMVGLLGWFGWEVTVISSNFISLQLIMTMAIAIHLIVYYRELQIEHPAWQPDRLVSETLRHKLRPCVYATLTTIAGFGSLVFCDILPVITFGWMMIAGLVVSLIVTFWLFPAILMMMPKPARPPQTTHWFPITDALAKITAKRGIAILILSTLALFISALGIARLRVENSFIDYFKKTTEIYQGMRVIDQSLGGTTSLEVTVDLAAAQALPPIDTSLAADVEEDGPDEFDEFDEFAEFHDLEEEEVDKATYWFTPEKMKRVKEIHAYLDSLPETGKVLSLATTLHILESLNQGETLDTFDLALLIKEAPESLKNMLIRPYVSIEEDQVRFSIRIRDSDPNLRRNALLKKMKADLTNQLGLPADRVRLTGMLVLYNNMLQSLFRSQVLTLGMTVVALMMMFLILFRSLKIALVAICPSLLSVALVLGIMGWLDIPLDMMTITIAAISVGIAVDDTIHYIHRFKEEFAKDRNYTSAMHRCHGSIGHAMFYTSVTIMIGFSIMTLSNFIPSIYFGLLTGLAMFIALIASLTLLPQLLIMTQPFGPATAGEDKG
ncbi:MAG: RND family transporter [Planctomycetes bacterium]|nr:RND family transporter [Planctomycetota bacterium]